MLSTFFQSITSGQARQPAPVDPVTYPVSVIENHSNSWWNFGDNALTHYHQGYLWFGSVSENGAQCVNRIGPDGAVKTGVVYAGLAKDEHNAATFVFLPNGEILAVGTGNASTNFWVRRFSLDLQPLTTASNKSGQISSGRRSYNQLYSHGTRVYGTTRRVSSNSWEITYTDNGGDNWAAAKAIAKNSLSARLYCLGKKVSENVVRITTHLHPVETLGNNFITCFELNLLTGEMTEKGVLKGNFFAAEGGQALDVQLLDKVYTPLPSSGFRMLDQAQRNGYVYLLVADFATSDYALGTYRLVRFNPNDYSDIAYFDLPAHGSDPYPTYFGGASFGVSDSYATWDFNVYLGREEGGQWYLERYTFNGASFTKTASIDTVSDTVASLQRPWQFVGDPQKRIVYQRNKYNGYTDWIGKLMMWKD